MSAPLHIFRPVGLSHTADEIHSRLIVDAQALAVAATADALGRSAPLFRRWGLATSSLPTVAATASRDGELGSVTIRWSGDECATGWPGMSARLLVTPSGPSASELTLVTTRSPSLGLAARRLDRFHQRRGTRVVVHCFLLELAGHLDRAIVRPLEPVGAPR